MDNAVRTVVTVHIAIFTALQPAKSVPSIFGVGDAMSPSDMMGGWGITLAFSFSWQNIYTP